MANATTTTTSSRGKGKGNAQLPTLPIAQLPTLPIATLASAAAHYPPTFFASTPAPVTPPAPAQASATCPQCNGTLTAQQALAVGFYGNVGATGANCCATCGNTLTLQQALTSWASSAGTSTPTTRARKPYTTGTVQGAGSKHTATGAGPLGTKPGSMHSAIAAHLVASYPTPVNMRQIMAACQLNHTHYNYCRGLVAAGLLANHNGAYVLTAAGCKAAGIAAQ